MSNSYKRTVAVRDLVSSDLNARRDFSDVEELASAIRATGNQPVNPIVVRPEGSKFRVIDGERRLRALQSLGVEMTDVVVYPEATDASEALAVLATDSKRRLGGSEVMRAYQQVLDLGVDDETVGHAVNVDADVVRRTRSVPRSLITEQTTLDALIAAADDEFSDDERKQIIAEGNRTYGDPEAQARRIRQRHKKERAHEAARLALADEFGEGIEFHDEVMHEWSARREGLLYIGAIVDAKGVAKLARKLRDGDVLHAYLKGTNDGFVIYRHKEDGELTDEEVKYAEENRKRDEHMEAYRRAFAEMCRYATEPWVAEDMASRHVLPANRRVNLCAEVMAYRTSQYGNYSKVFSEMGREILKPAASVAQDDDPALLEVCEWLMDQYMGNGLMDYYGTKVSAALCGRFKRVYDPLVLDGWEPSENAKALRSMCPEEKEESDDDAE